MPIAILKRSIFLYISILSIFFVTVVLYSAHFYLKYSQFQTYKTSGRLLQTELDRGASSSFHPQCSNGKWQRDYIQLHQQILGSPLEQQRISVMDASQGGLGDRLTTTASIFLHALLTKRAFKLRFTIFRLENLMDQPHINWTFSDLDVNTKFGTVEERNHLLTMGSNKGPIITKFTSDLTNDGEHVRTLIWRANQGQIHNLFGNPYHRGQLYAMGLRPETAAGCVLQFLFRPNLKVFAQTEEAWKSLLSSIKDRSKQQVMHQSLGIPLKYFPEVSERTHSSPTTTVALQIRFGDHVLFKKNDCHLDVDSNIPSAFFRCAAQLQKSLQTQVRLLLVTDCFELRKKAMKRFGGKRITTIINTGINHIESNKEDSLLFAIAEMWLIAATDYQVFTIDSSFGRLGSAISLQFHQAFHLNTYNESQVVQCDKRSFLAWNGYVMNWTRL